eukprot:m.97869 g.97869  ORF g.97869 m.97869 type:complete len:281 (-) comp27017_c1_seq2:55-897(-)
MDSGQGENDPLLVVTSTSASAPPLQQPFHSPPPPQAYVPQAYVEQPYVHVIVPPQTDMGAPPMYTRTHQPPRVEMSHPEEFFTADGDMQISGLQELCCAACWKGHNARIFHPKNDDHIVLNQNSGFCCCPNYSHDVLLLDEITGGQVTSAKSFESVVFLLVSSAALGVLSYFQIIASSSGLKSTAISWVFLVFLLLVWICCVINFFGSRMLGIQFFKQRGNLFLELPHSLGSRSLGYNFDIKTTQGIDHALKFVDTILAKAKLARSKSRTYNNQEALRAF